MNSRVNSFASSEAILLLKIVEQVSNIDSLDERWLKQIYVALNIGEGLEDLEMKKRLKVKIADIILIQRQLCLQYITLKKFQKLSEKTKKYLIQTFKRIWSKFSKQAYQFHQKIRSQYLPSLQKIDDYEAYHLNLFSIFQQSTLFPKNHINLGHYVGYQPLPMMSQGFNSSFGNIYQHTQPYMINYHFQGQLQQPYIERNIPSNYNYRVNDRRIYNPEQIFQMNNNIPMYYGTQQNNSNQIHKKNQSNSQEQFIHQLQNLKYNDIIKNQNIVEQEINEQKQDDQKVLYSLNFSYCVCNGSLDQQSQFYFECQTCKYYFHNNCLGLYKVAKQKYIKCPACTVNGPTIFTNVIQTIETAWVTCQSDKDVWNCRLQKKDIVKVTSNPQKCQMHLRFLKIDRSGKLNQDNKSKQQLLYYLNQNEKRIISSIKINLQPVSNLIQQLFVQVNPTDSTQILKQQILSPQLFFFGIYLVKINTIQQIMNQILSKGNNHVGVEYINSFFLRSSLVNGNQEISEVSVSLVDPITGRIIVTPVRGPKCTHPQAFDLEGFLREKFSEKEQIPSCPICQKKCDDLIIDDFMKSLIVTDEEGKVPCTVNYYSNGEFKYNQKTIKYHSNST